MKIMNSKFHEILFFIWIIYLNILLQQYICKIIIMLIIIDKKSNNKNYKKRRLKAN